MNLRYKNRINLYSRILLSLAVAVSVQLTPAHAWAAQGAKAQIKGTVTNGTAGKPAAGAEVTLLSLAGGMEETGRARTDSQGQFTLDYTDMNVPHLVRVDHQGVGYFQMVPPGQALANVTIYDAAKQVDNLIAEARIFQMQAGSGQLEIRESYTLRNESKPPRTKAGDNTFEVAVPEGAQVREGSFLRPNGMPLSAMPRATKQKNHYAFDNPLRPGESQFQVTYTLPYGGSQDFAFKVDMATAEVGVMLPKSMKFTPTSKEFLTAQEEGGLATYVAKSVPAGKTLQFAVAGEGSAPAEAQQGSQMPVQGGQAPAPGGGLGTPNTSPDPLSGLKWYVIAGIAAIMAGGVFFALRRKPSVAEAAGGGAAAGPSTAPAGRRANRPEAARAAPASSPGNMMDVIKEELFQLETDRMQGKISQQEYEASKAGLETLLRRQLKS